MTGAEYVLLVMPLVTLAVGVWCGIRIERHRRDRDLDQLLVADPGAADGGR